jgi:hypothetical protein
MSKDIIVRYVGYQVTEVVREYTFQVRDADEEREFRLNIANEAFVSHRARYQDAPGICAARLHAELTAFSNHPDETQFDITDLELDKYRESRSPKVGQNPWGRKAQQQV